MRDIGGLIWVIVVVIGVISSIVKNAKKAAAQREAARPRMAPQVQVAAPPASAAPSPAPVANRAIFDAPNPEYVAPLPNVVRAKPKKPAPGITVLAATPSPDRSVRGMFGNGTALVRAIVASEVLGPPKSQQERSIWSPRHSDPSI